MIRNSFSDRSVTVKSPAMPPRTPIRGVRHDLPTIEGILLANIEFNQLAAAVPLTLYLAKLEISMIPAFSRNIWHSKPTGSNQFCRVKPLVSATPGLFANHCGCSQP